MQKLTGNAFLHSGHTYDGYEHSSTSDGNYRDTFYLNRFLNNQPDLRRYNHSTGAYVYYAGADCRDMANFLSVLGKSLGLNVQTIKLRSQNGFFTKYILPTSDPVANLQFTWVYRGDPPGNFTLLFKSPESETTHNYHGWNQTGWSFHQVGYFSSDIYDACLKYDLSPPNPLNPNNYINQRAIWQDEAQNYGIPFIGEYTPGNADYPNGVAPDTYKNNLIFWGTADYDNLFTPLIHTNNLREGEQP